MSRLSENEQRELVNQIVACVKTFTPEWTEHEPSDPGITLIELFVWLTDAIAFKQITIADTTRTVLRTLLEQVAITASNDCHLIAGLARPRYFQGKLLTADDLQAEQDYSRKTRWLHNHCLFGWGIVTGLKVGLDGANNDVIVINPGFAIDRSGQELCVCEPVRSTWPPTMVSGYVSLSFCEQAVQVTMGESKESSRIVEGFRVGFGEVAPDGAVALAHLKRKKKKWVLDTRYRPRRAKFALR